MLAQLKSALTDAERTDLLISSKDKDNNCDIQVSARDWEELSPEIPLEKYKIRNLSQ